MSVYITEVDILEESKNNFLTFAEEVLTDRAVPNAEDGLLSSQRKLLWTSEQMLKMSSKGKTKKCSSLIGSCLSAVYTHGDQACYGVLCKMTQPYLMRYPLFEAVGNIGSQEANGMEAAPRYSEAKPSIYADLMFNDYSKNVVPVKLSYNNEYMEPILLPAVFPNALVNGKETIAVSLSHNSLPNNLIEVCNGIIEYIKNKSVTIEELMKYIKGPDFPLGGTIINAKDIYEAYNTGKSKVSLKVRGDYEIDEKTNTIVFTSIPYRTYRNKIKEQISKNVEELEKYIDDFNDESNVGINRLVFKIKRGVEPKVAVEKLFALTDLQTSLSYNMNYIVDGTPRMCSLIDLIKAYYQHQHNVITRAAQFDKEKAEARLHILEGLIVAVDKIDEVIALIKSSKDRQEAQTGLMIMLEIDEIQAKAILEMKLGKLTRIDKDELIQEKKEKIEIIDNCLRIINNFGYRDEILIKQVRDIRDKYGDERRTKLIDLEISSENLIPYEEFQLSIFKDGSMKKSNISITKRGTKGTKVERDLVDILDTNTDEIVNFFSAKGKMFSVKAREGNFIKLDADDEIVYVDKKQEKTKSYIFITRNGMIKQTKAEEFESAKRKSGIAAIKLKEGDKIAAVCAKDIEGRIIIVSHNGMSILLSTVDIPCSGRNTIGVRVMKLGKNDYVVGAALNAVKLAVCADDHGKQVTLQGEEMQSRDTMGILIVKNGEKVNKIQKVNSSEDIIYFNDGQKVIGIKSSELPLLSRSAQGVKIIG